MIFLQKKKNNNKHSTKYAALEPNCLGMHCFDPDAFALDSFDPEKNSIISRSLRTYNPIVFMCKGFYYETCPEDREFDLTLFKQRVKKGWKYSLW